MCWLRLVQMSTIALYCYGMPRIGLNLFVLLLDKRHKLFANGF
jgi:hypothetical protein